MTHTGAGVATMHSAAARLYSRGSAAEPLPPRRREEWLGRMRGWTSSDLASKSGDESPPTVRAQQARREKERLATRRENSLLKPERKKFAEERMVGRRNEET